ncbi:MAG TPA: hypothetical protein VH678_03150 [Xanthobacteraceae bacterium]|jgi:hypothetical protein
MDRVVRRVTIVQRSGDSRTATVAYEHPEEREDETVQSSPLLRPVERVMRRLLKAGVIFAQEGYKRHLESGERRNGWLFDAPSNVLHAGVKAYNEARKAVPFRLLPKVPEE